MSNKLYGFAIVGALSICLGLWFMGILNQYYGKEIVATLSINEKIRPEENTILYVHPTFIVQGEKLVPVDSNDFPHVGCFEGRLYGGATAESIFTKFGRIVSIRISSESDMNYTGNNNVYYLRYNPELGKDRSDLWFEEFKGRGLYQIIDSYKSFVFIEKERCIDDLDRGIYTNYILVRNKDKLYGPFEYDRKQGSLLLRALSQFNYLVGEYTEAKLSEQIYDVCDSFGNSSANFISRSAIKEPKDNKTNYDWIADDVVIDIFMEIMRTKYGYNCDLFRQVKEIVINANKVGSYGELSLGRVKKLKSLAQFVLQNEKYSDEYLGRVFKNEGLQQEFRENDIEMLYFEGLTDRSAWSSLGIEERLRKIAMKREAAAVAAMESGKEYDSLSQMLAAKQQAQESTLKTNTQQVVVDNTKLEKITAERDKLLKENENLNEKLTAIQDYDQIIEQKESLQAQIQQLKHDYKKLKQERDQAEQEKLSFEQQIDSKIETLKDQAAAAFNVLENKFIDKVLRSEGSTARLEELEEPKLIFDASVLSKDMSAPALIDRVSSFLNDKAHRNISNNDIANYLICLSQGFMTTFAGEPGTGKTSLCNLLAKSLGLATGVHDNRFVEISVERGWTSHKDFIGYYNPLIKSLEKSNVDAFNAFELLNTECGSAEIPYDEKQIAPFIMLLDEANLSPMEHYWAVFLKNCDVNSATKKMISLGGNKSFSLPPHLRFLATVNFDHTTEELSPRYLDRSWVIYLDPKGCEQDFGDDEAILNAKSMVSFGSLIRAFGVKEKNDITDAVAQKWLALQNIFANNTMPIAPRNLKMVRHYCNTACRCMDLEGSINKLAPIDYAFAQKILPSINGSGDQYKNLIEDLIKECPEQSMPITAKHLQRMNRQAKNNMGFYQFFAR